MLLFQYPKCTTCKKAVKWLDDNNVSYTSRNIKEEKPRFEELCELHKKSGLPVRKFFNTSGILYRSMALKDKLDNMTDEEMLELLSTDGMLVKRPILVTDNTVLVGFKESVWAEELGVQIPED